MGEQEERGNYKEKTKETIHSIRSQLGEITKKWKNIVENHKNGKTEQLKNSNNKTVKKEMNINAFKEDDNNNNDKPTNSNSNHSNHHTMHHQDNIYMLPPQTQIAANINQHTRQIPANINQQTQQTQLSELNMNNTNNSNGGLYIVPD